MCGTLRCKKSSPRCSDNGGKTPKKAMKKPRVLIVEDESSIAELIAVNLRHNGFEPIWSEDGAAAQREIDAFLPDLILLDWMLPGQSGLQLARQWRKDPRTKAIPILMLTARGDEPDKVAGLDAGATTTSPSPSRPRKCWPASVRCCAAGRRKW